MMMHPVLANRLDAISQRYEDLSKQLVHKDVTKDLKKYKKISQEYSEVKDIHNSWQNYLQITQQIKENEQLKSSDPELKQLAVAEIAILNERQNKLEKKIKLMLLPKDTNEECNVFLEIRMGTGGNEAAIFAGDLHRMYARFCERNNYTLEVLAQAQGEHGGYREIISRITGKGSFNKLKFESGGHRVQRVPVTETQGRIHTSAATVAVLPELKQVEHVDIKPSDIRIDTYRASGAGGQHVNKTDSAVRITHIETGIVVECQNERSQHKNKSRAMSLLASKIHQQQEEERNMSRAETRKLLIGSGDRSARIRTYNFPQGRITDHRINLTLYKINQIMDGDIEELITSLRTTFQNQELEQLLEDLAKQ